MNFCNFKLFIIQRFVVIRLWSCYFPVVEHKLQTVSCCWMTRITGRHKILVQMIILVFLNVPFFYCCLFAFFFVWSEKTWRWPAKTVKKETQKDEQTERCWTKTGTYSLGTDWKQWLSAFEYSNAAISIGQSLIVCQSHTQSPFSFLVWKGSCILKLNNYFDWPPALLQNTNRKVWSINSFLCRE